MDVKRYYLVEKRALWHTETDGTEFVREKSDRYFDTQTERIKERT